MRHALPWSVLISVVLLGLLALDSPGAQKDSVQKKKGAALDPRGRMEGSPTDKPARYYVWHDPDGWHLRSCSKALNRFDGSIRVSEGTIRKYRPVGLEAKGKRPDKWGLDDGRQEIKFDIQTSNRFDGFDFSVSDPSAEIEFDLRINGKEMPGRIFVGRDGQHPAKAKFSLPGDPERDSSESQ